MELVHDNSSWEVGGGVDPTNLTSFIITNLVLLDVLSLVLSR